MSRQVALLTIIVVSLFSAFAGAQEMETFDAYGVKYTIPKWPTDTSIIETFNAMTPELRAEILSERRKIINKFLRAVTITNPIARFREHFNPATADVWLEESKMLSEYGHFADRNPNIGLGAFKSLIEGAMMVLNNKIWATARIRGNPDHYAGKMQVFYFNLGGGLGNYLTVKGVKVPTSTMLFRSFVAFTFYDKYSNRWRTKFWFQPQLVNRAEAKQGFFGGEVGYRALQVYSLDPGLDVKGEFISFPGTPVAIESPRMAGFGFNISLNIVADAIAFFAAFHPASLALWAGSLGTQVISKVGVVQTEFTSEYIGELPGAHEFWRWFEGKVGIWPIRALDAVMPGKFKIGYLHPLQGCYPAFTGFRASVLGLSGVQPSY